MGYLWDLQAADDDHTHAGMNGNAETVSPVSIAMASQEAHLLCSPSLSSSEPDLTGGRASPSLANGDGPCSSVVAYEGPDRQTEVRGAPQIPPDSCCISWLQTTADLG